MRIFSLFLGLFMSAAAYAQTFETQAPQVYMKDLETGDVLLAKNADQKMVPSSMSKILTAHQVFDYLKNGGIKLSDTLFVSEAAWSKQGTKMFVPLNGQVSVEDLLKGVIVQSGNDACIVLAEGLGGTEAAFAEEMTRKAHEMGAKNTNFVNSTGWPDEGHYTTAKDLAIMAQRTIEDFPEQYAKYYGLKEFKYNNINQQNRNTLLGKSNLGADGMKTGHTDAGGYGIVASAKQGTRRIILVVNGLANARERDQEATALLNWGFNFFKNYKICRKDDVIEVADVWGGEEKTVPLVPQKTLVVTLPRSKRKDLVVKIHYDSPVAAPLKKGDVVGYIEATVPDKGVFKVPLCAGKDITRAWFYQRMKDSLNYLLWGKHTS